MYMSEIDNRRFFVSVRLSVHPRQPTYSTETTSGSPIRYSLSSAVDRRFGKDDDVMSRVPKELSGAQGQRVAGVTTPGHRQQT